MQDNVESYEGGAVHMSELVYCYRCGTSHPKSEMRQVETKNGKRWRCIVSIEGERQVW